MLTSEHTNDSPVCEIVKIHNIYIKKIEPHFRLLELQTLLNAIVEWITKLKQLQSKKFHHMKRESFCKYYITKLQETQNTPIGHLKSARSFEIYYNIHKYHEEGLSHVLQTLIDHNKNQFTYNGLNGLVLLWREFKQWYCSFHGIAMDGRNTLKIPPLQHQQILNYMKYRETKTLNTNIITSFVDLEQNQHQDIKNYKHSLGYKDIKKYKHNFYMNKWIKKWKQSSETQPTKLAKKTCPSKTTAIPNARIQTSFQNKRKRNSIDNSSKKDCFEPPYKKQKIKPFRINKIKSKQRLTISNVQKQKNQHEVFPSTKLFVTPSFQQVSHKEQIIPHDVKMTINVSKNRRYLQKINASNNCIMNYRKNNNIHISYEIGKAVFDPYNVYAIVIDLKWILDMIMGFKVDEFSSKKIIIPKNSLVMFHRKKQKLTQSDLQQYIDSRLNVILVNDVKKLCLIYARMKQTTHDSNQHMKTYNNEGLHQYLKPLKLNNVSFKNLSKYVNASTFKHIFVQIIKMINEQQISLTACRIYLGMTQKIEKFEHHVNYQFLLAEQNRKANYFTNKYKNSIVYHFSLDIYYFSEWERQFLEVTTSPSCSGLIAQFPIHNTLSLHQNRKYTAFVLKWPQLRSEIIYGYQNKLTNDMKQTKYPKQLPSFWQFKWKDEHYSA